MIFAETKKKLQQNLLKNPGKMKLPVIFLALVLLSAGCSSSGGGKTQVNINIWGVFETSDNMQPFIAAYQQKFPNVRITYTEKNVDNYQQDLLNALASGNGPDIFEIHNDWLPKYQDKLIEAPSQAITLKQYQDAFVDVVSKDFVSAGKIYAMPLSVDSLALYYNKDILGAAGIATPPKTWQELRNDVKLITRVNSAGTFTRSGVAMGVTSNVDRAADILYLLMLQNNPGSTYYTQDFSQSTLDQGAANSFGNTVYPAVNAASFYTTFSDPGSDVYTWNQNSNYSSDAFANGKLGFLYDYYFARDTILQKSPNLNFGISTVPQPNLDQNPVNFANYWGFGVSKLSKNPNFAWDFIRSMATKDSLTSYYSRHNLPSSRRDIIGTQTSDPVIGTFAFENLTAKSFFKIDADQVDQIILGVIDNIVLRGKRVQDSIADAAQKIDVLYVNSHTANQ